MIYISNALRPIESALKKMNQLPLLVKCVGTVALVIFLAIHLARKFNPSPNEPRRLEPARPVNPPAVNPPANELRIELPLRPADPPLPSLRQLMLKDLREEVRNDWQHMTRLQATQKDIVDLTSSFIVGLERCFEHDQFPDIRLSQLIPNLQKILKEDTVHTLTFKLTRILIERTQRFDSDEREFLIELSRNPKIKNEFRAPIFKVVKEGRVYPSATETDALVLFIEELQSSISNELHFFGQISALLADDKFRGKILNKAMALAPIGDSPTALAAAKLAFYGLYNEKNKDSEEWRKKLAIISAPLLRNCTNFILENILHTAPRGPFYPLLVQTLEICSTEQFLASFEDMQRILRLDNCLRDRIAKRLFSIENWQIEDVTPILKFLLLQGYNDLSWDEMRPILQWIKTTQDVSFIAYAFQELRDFANAPSFLKHYPMREELKSRLNRILYLFCILPDAQLTPEQQAFYAPSFIVENDKALYAHFFPGRFEPIALSASFNFPGVPPLYNLMLINLSLNTEANLKLLRENWDFFATWSNSNSSFLHKAGYAAILIQIFRKVITGCPAEQKRTIVANTGFILHIINEASRDFSPCAGIQKELETAKEMFTSPSSRLMPTADYLECKAYVEECKSKGLYPSEAKDPASFT